MRTNYFRAAFTFAAVLFYVLFVPLTTSAQEFRMTVESLSEKSDAVVVAKTVRSESFWNEDRSAILTRVFLQVEESLTGSASAQTEVIIPGGQIGQWVHEVSDMPHFLDDEESIVFLERHTSGVNVVAGGALGKITIEKDPVTQVRSISGNSYFLLEEDAPTDSTSEPTADGDTPRPTISKYTMTLDEFKKRLIER